MASLTQWTGVWVNSGGWWWTGSPGMLWSMGFKRVIRDWATELTDHLPMESKKAKLRIRVEWWLPGTQGWGYGKMYQGLRDGVMERVKGYKLPVLIWISSRNLIDVMIKAHNTVLHMWKMQSYCTLNYFTT